MKAAPIVRTARSVARRAANGLSRLVAGVGGSSRLGLIVVRDPRGKKVERMLRRLPFYFNESPLEPHVRIVPEASLMDILRARTVVEVDEGAVPGRYRWRFDHICKVDFDRNAQDGWQLCRVAQIVEGLPTQRRRTEAWLRLREAVARIRSRPKSRTYIFGTGRSLEKAGERDFSDGHVVVCNTIVRDAGLWHHLRPDLFVAGDAIYHFGHTSHARAFRADLWKRLSESDGKTCFVYPELFDAIVRRECGELENVLVPVPFGSHTDVHVDLCERFELPDLGNVLNILLLPLACTLSKSVWMWGFDGRAPDDKLFWSNSSRHSYPEFMSELQDEHPAFFATLVPKGRESTYVQTVHGDALDQRLNRAEAEGYQFVMMHFSWTDTLNKRATEQHPAPPGIVGPPGAPPAEG